MYQPRQRIIHPPSSLIPPEEVGREEPNLPLHEAACNKEKGILALVIDDDVLVLETFASILEHEGYRVECAVSAEAAWEKLQQTRFDIVLSDFYMPGTNGMDLLHKVRAHYPDLPVVMITAYGNTSMAREALASGASDFVTKPCSPGELPIVMQRNLTRQAVQSRHTRVYRDAILSSQESILDALLTALDTRDTETQGHSERVTAYTIELAERWGLNEEELYHVERGALLHDIGKIGVPDRILLKPGKLTEEEWEEMRRHPVIGYQMCCRIPSLQEAARIVLHHHEAWDGSGYPDSLHGEQIPLGARLFAIADTLDAMTSNRPYRTARTFSEARAEIVRYSSRQFDPTVVDLFERVPETRWKQLRARASE